MRLLIASGHLFVYSANLSLETIAAPYSVAEWRITSSSYEFFSEFYEGEQE